MTTFSYKGKHFLKNGKPYQVLSGAIHYWRVPKDYWEDRLKKLRACGFNTVETYIAWNLHERKEGQFDFSDNLDVVRFIEIAEALGLNVIIRPGPYICAEFDFGGMPSWLLAYPDMHLRCNDPRYLEKVRPYYRELFRRIRPHLCTNGGGIIMMQIENEYGSYGDDKAYLQTVADIYSEHGIDCLLYTSDGPCYWMLQGGTLPQYPAVANFGSRPEEAFRLLSDFRPDQPSMCGEFWCGWFDHWGEAHHTRTPEETCRDLEPMLKMGASLNFYMLHGGTNFGFTSGANHTETEYQPTVTSYDYCAPISEAGDLTPTFFAVRELIAKYTGILPPLDVADSKKSAYGKVKLTRRAGLFENLQAFPKVTEHAFPLTMEEVGQDFGFLLYSSVIHGPKEELSLELEQVHDRALVWIDGVFAGVKERTGRQDEIKLSLGKGEEKRIDLLMENCGRVNYGTRLLDKKGIVGGIRFGQQFHFGWKMRSMDMEELCGLVFSSDPTEGTVPAFFAGDLEIEGEPSDTFLRLDGFTRGFVKVNGHNLGRYRNDQGPQKTLYVPAPFLKQGKNEILVFETDCCRKAEIEFTDRPDLG